MKSPIDSNAKAITNRKKVTCSALFSRNAYEHDERQQAPHGEITAHCDFVRPLGEPELRKDNDPGQRQPEKPYEMNAVVANVLFLRHSKTPAKICAMPP